MKTKPDRYENEDNPLVDRAGDNTTKHGARLRHVGTGSCDSVYAKQVCAVLRENRDVWSEELIAQGGVTYERVKDRLQPLFYSTGRTYRDLGVHSVTFGVDGGAPPYIVAPADGSRLTADRIAEPRSLAFYVGPGGAEPFGETLTRLDQPGLAGGYYPVLQTGYRDARGLYYRQESFAGRLEGVSHLVAFVKITAESGISTAQTATLGVTVEGPLRSHLCVSSTPVEREKGVDFDLALADGKRAALYLVWSPCEPLPAGTRITETDFVAARSACQTYWDDVLEQGAVFDVPERRGMDVKRNLLIQNRIMRWRYSIGSAVYHQDFYQPESSDAMTVLGYFGYEAAARSGLDALVGMSKGPGAYVNWERGEKLCHAAHDYYLTRDPSLVRKHTPAYVDYLEDFRGQVEADSNGLLRKERYSGDIAKPSYCTFHQAVCWRGMRDMAEVWKLMGQQDLHDRYAPLANQFKRALNAAIEKSSKRLRDGSLFVSATLLDPIEPYESITETRLGSYWNLVMPYAFASGIWEAGGQDLDAILRYMHGHGSTLLGLLRFNYYPTPIGMYRPDGLAGYRTTGVDNVYLPNYIRMLADQDMPERLVASFYGKLAHGQTRGTHVCGEGDTIGPEPGTNARSCYGTPNSANNSAFLLMLRLMLVRESFEPVSGSPTGLHLAMATPRAWLEHGKRIVVRDAPTCFGPVGYEIASELDDGCVHVSVRLPERNAIDKTLLRLRVPGKHVMERVTIDGKPHALFDPESETMDLGGQSGERSIVVKYR